MLTCLSQMWLKPCNVNHVLCGYLQLMFYVPNIWDNFNQIQTDQLQEHSPAVRSHRHNTPIIDVGPWAHHPASQPLFPGL